ncbi:DNA-binding response regulator [Sinomicrobium pectinilyticum]|uniref:DNA-binding response regulator n=1 Tax=Sinomicrobium pectinilyticum TaxID=1084421 RepID=A0A3N0E504_SINP1|nr:response regulator transcription factor [Sinomicrobium pectinilyticum]RNL82908.1 DNA-binding response regulator [Sinomicrobium pectinilyticum]
MSISKISVVIVDDHSIVIEGLKSLLEHGHNLDITAHFTMGKPAFEFIGKERPDVILLDINLPDINGIDLCRQIKEAVPETKILALSNYTERNIIMQMLQSGANGYMLKNISGQGLLNGIAAVQNGEIYFSREINEIIGNPSRFELKEVPRLTKREKQVLALVAEGKTTTEIADILHVSPLTIETHRRNLHYKFQVRNVAELVMAATKCQFL